MCTCKWVGNTIVTWGFICYLVHMKIHMVLHEAFEGAGAIVTWAESRGVELSYTRVYLHETLPGQAMGFDVLIVMGGPQSPATLQSECPHFDAVGEMRLIKQAIQAEKFVLGVCLGAQLIGEALGAAHAHSPQREIGVFPIKLTPAGMKDRWLKGWPETLAVGHWHGDMPGLTEEAVVLAQSEGCPRQIVRYGPKVYGFQCHFEFDKRAITAMIEHCGAELQTYEGGQFIQDEQTLLGHDYDAINQYLFDFLDRVLADFKS